MTKLLVVVDYQNDFVDGALGFTGAFALEEGIIQEVEQTLGEGGCVLFTRDTHQADYLETREGRFLPVSHCVEGTAGHQLYGRLHAFESRNIERVAMLNKETFGSRELVSAVADLCQGAPESIALCGVATDICVVSNAIILHTGFPDADISILTALCGSPNGEGAQKALDVMAGLGMTLV